MFDIYKATFAVTSATNGQVVPDFAPFLGNKQS